MTISVKNTLRIILLLALFLVIFLSGCKSGESTPPSIPVLEPGQNSQFPGFNVTMKRAVWQGDTLETYWTFTNTGTKTLNSDVVVYPFLGKDDSINNTRDLAQYTGSNLFMSASDGIGNPGQTVNNVTPQWDTIDKNLFDMGRQPLNRGETLRDFQCWSFSPSSNEVHVRFTYFSNNQAYQVDWKTGR